MSDDVVERIKKLLRLAQSSNPHEAQLALSRAYEIAARHQIDLTDVGVEAEVEDLLHKRFPIGLRITFLKRKLIGIIVSFFNVDAVYSGGDVVLIGTNSDVEIAWYVFELLVEQGKRQLRVFEKAERQFGRRSTKKKRDSFVAGFVYGLAAQLERSREQIEIEDSRFAIVLVDQQKKREQHMHSLFPELGAPRRQRKVEDPNKLALLYGFQCGRSTRISKPLNRGTETLLLQ
jgi:hypothetical protein